MRCPRTVRLRIAGLAVGSNTWPLAGVEHGAYQPWIQRIIKHILETAWMRLQREAPSLDVAQARLNWASLTLQGCGLSL